MSNISIFCVNMIADNLSAAAQMSIIYVVNFFYIYFRIFFAFLLLLFGIGSHGICEVRSTPQSSTIPIIGVSIISKEIHFMLLGNGLVSINIGAVFYLLL